MALTYTTWYATLLEMLVIGDDASVQTVVPSIIGDAEQRIYRETDLLATIVRDTSGTLTPNSRNFTFPQHFVVSESINVFSTSGNRKALIPVSREWMDAIYGSETAPSTPSVPSYYAMITDQTIIVGPPPSSNYQMEVVGTVRPTPLSESNPTTYLSLYLPDLFMAATLVFGYGYLKNFGAMSDDPKSGLSWEAHYQALSMSANIEEQRKHYASQAWTPKQPAPLATPPRV